MPVVETDEFRPETKRESQHLHAGPAGHQEMTQFMEENDNRQHEQEGNDVANKAMAQRIETMKKKLGHPIPLKQSRRPGPYALRLVCGNLRQEGGSIVSRSMVNGDGIVRGRQGCEIAGAYPVVHRRFDQPRNGAKPDLATDKRRHGHFVGGIIYRGRATAGSQRIVSQPKSRETTEIRRLKRQLSDLGQIKLRCRTDDAVGPSEAM